MTAPHALTASTAAAAIRTGTLTAEALMRSCLDRINAREPDVRAWLALDAEGAMAAARAADRSPPRGPLHGVPLGVKDVIDTGGLPTTYGSPLYKGFQPAADASCVALLRQAGGILLGKTDTVEFAAAGHQPRTRNPHNLAHTPGGSSSGSGAAVSDSMVPLALSTQTGGSTIRPASFTGIFALKPTFGTVARDGVRSFAPSLDTVGWCARSIDDLDLLARAYDLTACLSPRPETVLRIGLYRGPHWASADDDARHLLEQAAGLLQRGGLIVTDCILDGDFGTLTSAQERIMFGEGRVSFLPELHRSGEALHPLLRDIAINTRGITADDLRSAYDHVARCRVSFENAMRSCHDAIMTLAAPGEAPIGFATTGDATFNKMWTALGVPCLAIPLGNGCRGLPIGMQLVAPRFADRRLLAVGRRVAGLLADARSNDEEMSA